MNTWPVALAGSLTRGWVRAYTMGLPTRIRAERKEEIASDLWEQASAGGNEGESANAIAAHIFGRAVLGMPIDVAWHLGKLKRDDMQLSNNQKTIVGAFFVLRIATLVFGVLLIIGGMTQDWLFNDMSNTIMDLMMVVFMVGPFVAVVGVYAWRRADAEGRSTKNARTLIVVGTLGIAGMAGFMWWTIVGPTIAIGIVAYWANKIGQWRSDPPRLA